MAIFHCRDVQQMTFIVWQLIKKQNAVISARIHIKEFLTRLYLVLIIKILKIWSFFAVFYVLQYSCTYTNHFFGDWKSEIFIWSSSKKGETFWRSCSGIRSTPDFEVLLNTRSQFWSCEKKMVEYVCASPISVTHIQLQNIPLNLFLSQCTKNLGYKTRILWQEHTSLN